MALEVPQTEPVAHHTEELETISDNAEHTVVLLLILCQPVHSVSLSCFDPSAASFASAVSQALVVVC